MTITVRLLAGVCDGKTVAIFPLLLSDHLVFSTGPCGCLGRWSSGVADPRPVPQSEWGSVGLFFCHSCGWSLVWLAGQLRHGDGWAFLSAGVLGVCPARGLSGVVRPVT